MEYIVHRKNTIKELNETEKNFGVEVDVRSSNKNLIICHDPFTVGVSFLDWIENYNHGTLILNVKEEGLEDKLIQIMKEKNIEKFFFLDQSFPFLIKWSNFGFKKSAVRVSEYELIDSALKLAGKVDWVWLDCFNKFPLNKDEVELLKSNNFKICMVSPELQGKEAKRYIPEYFKFLKNNKIIVDAICTKHPYLWIDLENINA